MADIWLWNSIATRKRSPSDGFLENGLAILKSYVEKRGHKARVIDWQKSEFYDRLCPRWLLSLNRLSTITLLRLGKKKNLVFKIFFLIFNILQDIVSIARKHREKHYLKELAKDVVKNGIKVFGIKVWYGEAFYSANLLVKYIHRKDPSVLCIAGGFHSTLYEEDLLKNSVFDVGVVSEGEKPLAIILDIANRYEKDWDKSEVLSAIKEKIGTGELKNIVYRDNQEIKVSERYVPDMGSKVFPKYDKENIEGKLKIHVLLDSLGCPWGRCNFCVHSHFYPKFYPRPVEHVISEIEYMLKMGVGLFRFAGSETPPAFGVKIAQAILDKGLKIRYSIGCRAVNKISESSDERYRQIVRDFEIMLKAGLRAIFMGGETGNDVINDKIMNKGVRAADIIKTAVAYKEAQKNTGIKAYLSLALIYPPPLVEGISLEDVFMDNITLSQKTMPDSVIVSPAAPFKNTIWYNHRNKFGITLPKNFIKRIITYEYVLYKPPSMWPYLGNIRIGDVDFIHWLEECQRQRQAIEKKGIPSDLTDEYFLMIEAGGYSGKEGLERFKKETSVDLISSDYRNIGVITKQVNRLSEELAKSNA